jgi:hypothetical protein
MDKNGRFFGKISVIDIVVVLLLALLVAAVVWRFTAPAAQVGRGDTQVDFTLRITGVRDFTLPYYQEGLRMYSRSSGQYVGSITGFTAMPSYDNVTLHSGEVIRAARPGRVDIYLDLTAEGRVTPNAIYAAGNFQLSVGSVSVMQTRYIEVNAVVMTVNPR